VTAATAPVGVVANPPAVMFIKFYVQVFSEFIDEESKPFWHKGEVVAKLSVVDYNILYEDVGPNQPEMVCQDSSWCQSG